ncbi:MAG: c-type cytochrome, partial [Gammaproteobacteria bacterium]|nr:c-type cytochrome [Gammaproteobacteria bacterium]
EVDLEAINNPSDIASTYYERIEAASAAGGGDPGAGEEMFTDNCSDCHQLNGEGGEVGPDLSAIASKGLKFISESILVPAKKITEGYETFTVVDKEGLKTIGIKTRDTATEVDIMTDTGEVITFAKSDIEEITEDEGSSVMPDDLTEALTVKDFQDIQAFLMLQKGEEDEQ